MDGHVLVMLAPSSPVCGGAENSCYSMHSSCYSMSSPARSGRSRRWRSWLLACFSLPPVLVAREAKSAEAGLAGTALGVAIRRLLMRYPGATVRREKSRRRFHSVDSSATAKPIDARQRVSDTLSTRRACSRPPGSAALEGRESCAWRNLKAPATRPWRMLPRNQLAGGTESARTLDDEEPPSRHPGNWFTSEFRQRAAPQINDRRLKAIAH